MASYSYVAVSNTGERIEGKKSAASKTAVIDELLNQGLTIVSIQEDFALNLRKAFDMEIGGFSISEKVILAKQLSTMIAAGISIIQAIDILRQQAEKDSMREVLSNVYQKIEAGSSLSAAFKQEKKIFNEVQISLIEAGEKSGNLNEMLVKVAEDMEKSKQLRGKILGALIYPAIIFVVLIGIVALMILFMIPQVEELYLALGQDELPFVTELLVTIGKGVGNPIVLLFLFFMTIFIVITYRMYNARPDGRLVVDGIKLKIPVFGSLMAKIQLTEFCRLTAMLLSSGIPIIEAIDIVANSLSNSVFSTTLRSSKAEVTQGSTLSLGIAKHNKDTAFSLMLIKMIAIGEESGNLDKVLSDMYRYYDAEVEQISNNLTKLLEPFILVVVGGLVAFLAIAIYLPIYQVGDFI